MSEHFVSVGEAARFDAAKAANVACNGHTVEALHPWEAILDHTAGAAWPPCCSAARPSAC